MRSKIGPFVFLVACWVIGSWSHGQDAAKKSDEAIVKLLDAGAAPRQQLRMLPKKGLKQKSIMTMKLDQAIVMNGNKLPTPSSPPMQFTFDITVTDVASSGEFGYDYSYTKVDVLDDPASPSPIAGVLKQQLKPFEGMSGSSLVTNRGFAKKNELKVPAGVTDQMRLMLDGMKDSMSRICSPLPEEPIGMGGKWSVVQNVVANGMKLQQTSIQTLKGITDSVYNIDVEVTQTAEPQTVQAPGLPPGTTLELQSLESSGKGKMSVSPRNVLPTSEMSLVSKAKMSVNVGGQSQKMDTETKMEMKVGPVENGVEASKK